MLRRKLYVNVLIVILICMMAFTSEASGKFKIYVNGNEAPFDESLGYPFAEHDRTFVPIRFIGNYLGFNSTWDQSTQTATIYNDETTIQLGLNKLTAVVNGWKRIIDSSGEISTQVKNDRIYVPLRFVSETMGAEVNYNWNNGDHEISIVKKTEVNNQDESKSRYDYLYSQEAVDKEIERQRAEAKKEKENQKGKAYYKNKRLAYLGYAVPNGAYEVGPKMQELVDNFQCDSNDYRTVISEIAKTLFDYGIDYEIGGNLEEHTGQCHHFVLIVSKLLEKTNLPYRVISWRIYDENDKYLTGHASLSVMDGNIERGVEGTRFDQMYKDKQDLEEYIDYYHMDEWTYEDAISIINDANYIYCDNKGVKAIIGKTELLNNGVKTISLDHKIKIEEEREVPLVPRTYN